ncbi:MULTISPECIES: helicase-exonuclease AddAB subunit AddB [Clostridia]|jgi:ATP-dependent helicase/nuclease subunit B|uniref:helicase-exonuclease AddAB subunit AddB n=1 Tax=Clostridia TaxID=186801 RepID=UPI000E4BB2FF|nr:helicase-exonuclease AddAB subunit AddB [Clostridium sp. AF34-10BH]RHP28858.1 helicase-exonuclease AddAB subunit AddB [Clostridium sp. AF34-10BH]
MSLRFCFGPSGSGKSHRIYEEIMQRAAEEPGRNFLIIVPDQFTMQTQKDLVMRSDRDGILNIDVLSFGRLSHRILEEVGTKEMPVLDDTGKSLVLQKVAADLKEQLPAMGSLLHKQGYIHEVKSAISEFMQYGISTQDMDKLITSAQKRGALAMKLKDLKTLYRGFQDYIRDHFITTEETLDVLRRSLSKSKILKGSVVVFDGFTGFTPIQNRLIQELMRVCAETIVTVTIGVGEDPYKMDGEQKLFHLSKKTVADLEKLAAEAEVERGEDLFVKGGPNRFAKAPALHYLEQNLFRYQYEPYAGEQQEIHMFEALSPREEVHQTALYIRHLIREQGMTYRDIAVVIGDLEGYASYVETEFGQLEIPCFLDRTRGIVLNPMIEYIKSALQLYIKDFSYDTVFHFLRSGMADISREEIDELENYVIRTGARGYRTYSRLFTRRTEELQGNAEGSEQAEEKTLERLNRIRQQFMDAVEILHMGSQEKAGDYVSHLYDFLEQNQVQQKLLNYQQQFEKEGDLSRAREYAQIYRLVMDLLDQVYELLGEEEISRQEFADILEAGFGEITVGTIPQNVDRIVVGDMERTRLKQVKVLFFLGVNDGSIPKNASKGGIISDMDREFLIESGTEMAPSPRQQMYIQRLYLYLNMTKPSEQLYLSYAKVNSEGKGIRPSYLIDTVRKLFPAMSVEYPQNRSRLEQIEGRQEGARYLAEELREYVEGTLPEEERQDFYLMYRAYEADAAGRDLLTRAAFRRYRESGLSRIVARALYGQQLENSVSRLEAYAACACRHFLQYGLSLQEREEFGFEVSDMGTVYHAVLENFAGKLAESNLTWWDFTEDFAAKAVKESVEAYAATYGETVLYSSARNEYAITRMSRILTRTVLTLQKHLKQGSFQPDDYELSFRFAEDLDSIHVDLSEDEKMHLQGRIDRIDVSEDAEHVYVKVIDYKSGNRKFDLAALYYGLQLQLVVYMNAAMEMESRKHPDKEIVPAALLYYHIDDPTIETPVELTDEQINEQILAKLRMNGVVNSDPEVVERLDRYMQDKSVVIPVEKKKDGSFSARSGVLSREEMQLISSYVDAKIRSIGREILDGKIAANPYEKGNEEACTYCAYKKVCGFDGSIPGYEKRQLEDLDKQALMQRMQKTVEA